MSKMPVNSYTVYIQKSMPPEYKKDDSPQYRITNITENDTFSRSNNTDYIDKEILELQQRQREKQIRRERAIRRKKAAQRALIKRMIAGAAALSGICTAVGGLVGFTNQNRVEAMTSNAEQTGYIETYEHSGQTIDDILNEMSIEDAGNKTTEESVQEIFAANPEVKEAYDKLTEAVDRFSSELGEDGMALIKERVELLGNGRVDELDVLKVLYIESRGRIYDPEKTGEIIRNEYSGATGPFQLTSDSVDYINYYYSLEGSDDELDIENPYDNLDACILYLRLINAMRQDDMENGTKILTGDNIKHAMVWGYHDGPWADFVSYQAEDYISVFDELSEIDNYSEVVNYLLNE